jgi:pimeloyl-ACP methyl ester carboxylesterase
MRRALLAAMLVAMFGGTALVRHAPRNAWAVDTCTRGTLPSGALSLICIPGAAWNGDLVVWAHGYTAYNQPLDFQNLNLPGGIYLPDLVQALGFAFATTSYRTNGLAVLQGVDDIRQLVAAFRQTAPRLPAHTYLVGASEGGLITTLLAEQSPELFSGALAACGPVGDFRAQINYFGDFRVLFNYFFPGVIPGDSIQIPQEVIDDWDTKYSPAVTNALISNPLAALQLISTSKAPIDWENIGPTTVSTAQDLLWYNVFATNDAAQKLGGNPYGNLTRWYWGSADDLRLNLSVERFAAAPTAINALNPYQTTGNVRIPLITLHTVGDDIVPFWHEVLYAFKAHPTGRGSLIQIPVFRYGHCNFTANEMLGAFALLLLEVTGTPQAGLSQATNVSQAKQDFARAQQQVEAAQRADAQARAGKTVPARGQGRPTPAPTTPTPPPTSVPQRGARGAAGP